MTKTQSVTVGVLSIVVFGGLLSWYLWSRGGEEAVLSQAEEAKAQAAQVSLGTEIYDRAKSFIGDKLSSANPVGNANPIEGAYKNPFE